MPTTETTCRDLIARINAVLAENPTDWKLLHQLLITYYGEGQ